MNKQLEQNNFIFIPNFISVDKADQISSNFNKFCRENNISGDSQVTSSFALYNFIDFLELLCDKTPEISKHIGEYVLPTYSYARVYKNGAELLKHKDRAACEISLTVHLDGDKDWPIFVKKPNDEQVSISLKVGDALLYLGREAEHWREPFDGEHYTQVFLHYVKSRGKNNYAFFDREASERLINIPITQGVKIHNYWYHTYRY